MQATDAVKEGLEGLSSSRNAGKDLVASPADISAEQECLEFANVARETAGRVDMMISCAGYLPILLIEDMSAADWRRVIDINLTGTFLMTHAMLPLMKVRGRGRTVNFSSGSVFNGVPAQTHYVAAKAGIIGFSRSLTREVGGYGITVNVVTTRHHGSIGQLSARDPRSTAQRTCHPARRAGRGSRGTGLLPGVAGRRFISPQILNVNGGMSMH